MSVTQMGIFVGLAEPISYGLSVSGAGAFRSTAGILLSGPGTHPIWNRGIVFANDCVTQSTFQDLGTCREIVMLCELPHLMEL